MANDSLGAPTGVTGFSPADHTTPLQQALESLSVNLEDELIRYRQSRAKQGAPQPYNSQLKFRSRRRRQGLNLIQVPSWTAPSPQVKDQTLQTAQAVSQAVQVPVAPEGLQSGVATLNQPTAPGVTLSVDQLAPMPPVPPNPRLQQSLSRQGRPVAQTYAPQSAVGTALQRRPGAITSFQQLPEDYLESTEALLDSLPSPYGTDDGYDDDGDYEPTLREQLTTPFGIGALLLLLVGSAGFGYFVTSPKTAEFLRNNPVVQALQQLGTAPEAAPEAAVVEEPNPLPQTGLQGIGPDLSEGEFQKLDLGRLSTLEQDQATPSSVDSPLRSEAQPLDRLVPTRAGDAPNSASARPSGSPRPVQAEAVPIPSRPVTVTQPQAVTVPARPQPAVAPQPQPVPAPQPQMEATPPQSTGASQPLPVPAPRPVTQTPPQPMPPATPAVPVVPPQPLVTNGSPPVLPAPQGAPPAPLSQPSQATTAPTAPVAPAPIAPPSPITQPPPQVAPGAAAP